MYWTPPYDEIEKNRENPRGLSRDITRYLENPNHHCVACTIHSVFIPPMIGGFKPKKPGIRGVWRKKPPIKKTGYPGAADTRSYFIYLSCEAVGILGKSNT